MVERSPATPTVLSTRFERLLGCPPDEDRFSKLLERLNQEDKIRPVDPDASNPTYGLTQEGARCLNSYRSLPSSLSATIPRVIGRPPSDEAPEALTLEPVPSPATGWVQDALHALPEKAPIQAPYARFTFTRDAARNGWSLEVQHHAPSTNGEARECPLTFLYLAGARLLTQPGRGALRSTLRG